MTGLTTDEWLVRIGDQVRAVRISSQLSQAELAERASVGESSIRTLERGGGSSLKTIVAVARVLHRTDWLDAFDPRGDGPSPIELLRQRRRQPARPQRVRKPKD